MLNEAEYNRLRACLTVDPNALDDALINIAMQQMEIAEYTADAARARDQADFYHDQVSADVAAKLRGSDKMSEARIKSEVALYDEVATATTELIEAERSHTLWKGLADAIRTKSSSIRAIADLITAGYMTSNTIHHTQREVLHEQRRQQPYYAAATGANPR